MTASLNELQERAAQGDLDPADLSAFAAELGAVALERLAASTSPDTASARAYMVRCQVADAQAQVSALLANADLIEWEGQLANAVTVARAQLQAAEQTTAQAHELAEHRADDARLAADEAARAAEYAARMAKAVDDLAAVGASPQQRTDSVLRADAAGNVARQTTETATRAASAAQDAQQHAQLGETFVRDCRAALVTAETAHANAAETVRPSAFTLAVDWPRLLASGERLTGEELGVVRGFVQGYAALTGADQDMRRKADQDAQTQAREALYQQMVRVPSAGGRLDAAAATIHHPGDGGPFNSW